MKPVKSLFNLNILLVDDDPDILHALQEILKDEPYFLKCVSNGFEAIREIKETDATRYFDLILLDIHMPEMDGRQAVRVIKDIAPQTKVVAYTATLEDKTKEDFIQLGFDDHIRKGMKFSILKTVILDFCKKILSDYNEEVHEQVGEQPLEGGVPSKNSQRKKPALIHDLRVLVVDDDPDILTAVKHATQDELFQVDFSENGVLALKKIENSDVHFDVIILDINMPFMDGFQTIQALSSFLDGAKIIAHTVESEKNNKENLIKHGFHDFLPKPLPISELKKQIHQICFSVFGEDVAIPVDLPDKQDTFPETDALEVPTTLHISDDSEEEADSYGKLFQHTMALQKDNQDLQTEIKALKLKVSQLENKLNKDVIL